MFDGRIRILSKKLLRRSQHFVHGERLDSVRRGPGKPFVAEVFGDHDVRLFVHPPQKNNEFLFAILEPCPLVVDDVPIAIAETVDPLDLLLPYARLLEHLAVGALQFGFPGIDVALGQIPPVGMTHQ